MIYLPGSWAFPGNAPSLIVICRWGPLDIPALPDFAIICPCLTVCPFDTLQDDKCPYSLVTLGDVKQKTVNKILLDAIVKSFYYHKLMFENKLTSEQKANTHIHRLMKLRFLPKEIITVILTGEQEPNLTINKLYAYL